MVYIHAGALTIQLCKPTNRKSHVCTLMGPCCLDVVCVCLKGSELRDPGSLGMPVSVSVCLSRSLCISLSMCRWAGRTERERPAHGWSFTLPVQLLQHNVNQQDLRGHARPPSISLVHAPHQMRKISQRAFGGDIWTSAGPWRHTLHVL